MIHIEHRVSNSGQLFLRLMAQAMLATRDHDLVRELGREAGYCLDAPELIPAGGMQWWDLDEDLGLPEQLLTTRE